MTYANVTDSRGCAPWWVEYTNGEEGVLWAATNACAHRDAGVEARLLESSYTLLPATVEQAKEAIVKLHELKRASPPYTWEIQT